ncbi:RNA polymerase sigma-70 factor [Pedobacter frigidisoli]|uniref:RNA polymerase sigma-70 factor n=1 Tax=Pedobacter frigidisoli TaxID=2530455 RepID=UPI0013F17852|nr:RNA polymerase sigma-70 factor [Pedobacter frigidisoli]
MKEISEGNERSFSVLFFNYLPILQSFALKFTKSETASEEIIQDAFLRVWLHREKLEHVDNVKAYLYKFVSNECLGFLRKTIKEGRIIDSARLNQPVSDNNTSDSIQLNEVVRIINDAVNKLPSQRKKIYNLSRSEGKTIPEIANILNLSPNTVKNTLISSLKSIRNHLNKSGIEVNVLVFIMILEIFENK